MRNQALISLTLLGLLMVFLASTGGVHATYTRTTKEHHPPSTFTDPSGSYDGYLVGQTVTFHIHLNVTTVAGGPWLKISNLTIADVLPNLSGGGPLYVSYVNGSQNSSSDHGAAAFTDFGNGTLLWNFGHGPFTTGVLAPPPFGDPTEFYTASITFNATILGTVLKSSYLTNAGLVSYTETVSLSNSNPGTSDTIWVYVPSNFVPQVPLLGTAGAGIAMALGLGAYLAKRRKTA